MVLNGRNARGAAHQQHAAQLGRGDAGVVERGLHGTRRALHQIARHVVERGARERGLEVQRARRALRQELSLIHISEERALTVDERCEVLSQQKGLTKRETEVLHLLARGRTGVFIQHELCVSYNTIKAHVKHIYQKLDVHTHQELIDLVEDLG